MVRILPTALGLSEKMGEEQKHPKNENVIVIDTNEDRFYKAGFWVRCGFFCIAKSDQSVAGIPSPDPKSAFEIYFVK